ncbi:MAG TPA: polysaccharide deacetylase family protein [Streptosporangiaceae bacterium]|nr:polysaccharide deacetylase family protein [Streptosporangiaceae bacterium]
MTKVAVLMYHAVGQPLDERFRPWVVPPSLLAEHLSSLGEAGYELVGLTEWAAQRDDRKRVVLTFDDGYADFAENALPVLASHGARATVYVVTGYVGDRARWLPFAGERDRPMMTWGDLETARAHGIEVGSHGHRHIELDAVGSRAAASDIERSRDALTSHGFPPRSFCYPFGYNSRSVRRIVAGAGFTNACVVGRGLTDSGQDLLRVRRLAVDSRTTPEALLRRFGGPAMPVPARLREAAQPTWRLTRRARSMARRVMRAEVAL